MSDDSPQEQPQIIEACPGCGALLDVSEQEPFETVHCPSCGAQMRARTQFRNFKLLAQIGQGGMGRVFKAVDLNLNRNVALKVLRKELSASPEDVGRLEREARLTASVNHPHVIKIFSFGSDHGRFFLAMELVDKGSLDDLMGLQGMVSELQVLEIGSQIASGLEAALRAGLIHRDVKPGNILFADAHTAKIVDFGLALLMDEEAAQRGEIWGTPYYIAPEKLDGRPEDFRSDIYSLGATLFHAVAGRPPYEASTASMVALKHLKSMPVSLQAFAPHVSGETNYVINRMLHKDPDQRYQSYTELIEHLDYAREKVASKLGRPRSDKARPVVESEESVTLMGWISLALLLLVLGGIGFLALHWSGLLNKKAAPEPPAPPPDVRRAETRQEREERRAADYQAARSQLAAGDVEPAYNSFIVLSQDPDAAAFRNWCLAHLALCSFLTGRAAEGDSILTGPLAEPRPQGRAATEEGLDALARIAALAARPAPIPPAEAARLDSSGPEAFGLLLAGVKNWHAGAIDEGQAFLDAFSRSAPGGAFAWIADYKNLIRPHLDDHQLLTTARQAAASAGDSRDDRARALKRVRDLKARVVSGSEILHEFGKLEKQLLSEPAPAPAPSGARIRQPVRLSDPALEARLREAEDLLRAARSTMDFRPASERFRDLAGSATGPARHILEARAKSVSWLAEFPAALQAAAAAGASPGPLHNRAGRLLGDRIAAVTPAGLKIASPYGAVTARWTELDPAQIAAAARNMAASLPPGDAARLIWLAGVFAFETGAGETASDLLTEAAAMSDSYKDELPLYFDFATASP